MHGHISRVRILVLFALALVLPLQAQQAEKQTQAEKQAQEDAAKKVVDEFTNKMKDAKTVPEKALLIQGLGDVWPKDNAMVGPIARYLNTGNNDINYILPVMAADALAKFRNNGKASQMLIASLPAYKKIPYVYNRILMAIGKVGHESALTLFEEPLKGKDINPAIAAVEAISEMPAAIALETLYKEYERMEKGKDKASDDLKKVYEKVMPEIIKAIKKVSGQPYPTIAELRLWWQKRGQAFKDEANVKEKERLAKATGEPSKGGIPPPLIVELLFKENGGDSTANSGTSSGTYATATVTKTKPSWTATSPTNGGPAALDWGATPSPGAVDLSGGAGIEHLKGLKSFTISGWINLKGDKEAPGDKLVPAGNRILTWLNHGKDGVELVHRASGGLQIGINQWADQSVAASDPTQIPIMEEKPKDVAVAERANWRFFAVTSDSSTNAGHVKFYFGTLNADAKLNRAVDCDRGPVGMKIGPNLTVGNLNAASRPMAPDRCSIKGILDEIKIYGSTVDGSGALDKDEIIRIQNRVAATP